MLLGACSWGFWRRRSRSAVHRELGAGRLRRGRLCRARFLPARCHLRMALAVPSLQNGLRLSVEGRRVRNSVTLYLSTFCIARIFSLIFIPTLHVTHGHARARSGLRPEYRAWGGSANGQGGVSRKLASVVLPLPFPLRSENDAGANFSGLS